MKKTRHTTEQIIRILREAEASATAANLDPRVRTVPTSGTRDGARCTTRALGDVVDETTDSCSLV